MASIHSEVASLLLELEKELREIGLWEQQAPTAHALASVEPFAVDTLEFHQWLQFIFLPRMAQLVNAGAALPTNCNIAPMADEVFKECANAVAVIDKLRQIDRLLSLD